MNPDINEIRSSFHNEKPNQQKNSILSSNIKTMLNTTQQGPTPLSENTSSLNNQIYFCNFCENQIAPDDMVYNCECQIIFHASCIVKLVNCSKCGSEIKNENQSNYSCLLRSNLNNIRDYSKLSSLAETMSPCQYKLYLDQNLANYEKNEMNFSLGKKRNVLTPITENTPICFKQKEYQDLNLIGIENKNFNLDTQKYDLSFIYHDSSDEEKNNGNFNDNENEYSRVLVIGNDEVFIDLSINNDNKKIQESNNFHINQPNNDLEKFHDFISDKLSGKLGYKNLEFDCDLNEIGNGNSGFYEDKENGYSIIKDTSKFDDDDCPLELNVELGLSHINSLEPQKIELPILIDLKLKEEFVYNYKKVFYIIVNTEKFDKKKKVEIRNIIDSKIKDSDLIFTNLIYSTEYLTKKQFVDNSRNPDNYVAQDTLNFEELHNLIMEGFLESINDTESDIYSFILINDIANTAEEGFQEKLESFSEKITQLRSKTNKSITFYNILLGEQFDRNNLNYITSMFNLTQSSLGLAFHAQNNNEALVSLKRTIDYINQISLLNLSVEIRGNKDPSMSMDVLNFKNQISDFNNFNIFLGNILKKEKKSLVLEAIIHLKNLNIKSCFPLIEVRLEYSNSHEKSTIKSSPLFLTIPITNIRHDIEYSYKVYIKYIFARIAKVLDESLQKFLKFEFEDAINLTKGALPLIDKVLKDSGTLMFLNQLFEISSGHNNNRSTLANSNYNLNQTKEIYNTTNEYGKKLRSLFNLLFNDCEFFDYLCKNNDYSQICRMFTTVNSLKFNQPVDLNDARFLEDVLETI